MKETCTIDYNQHNISFSSTTDQWSSTSSPRSPPSAAPPSLNHHAAAAGCGPTGNSKLNRMDSDSSVILDLLQNEKEPQIGDAEPKKLPSSKYKGVVPQPNGRWGAQIYIKHQRLWLGTFGEEETAAKAYDIAAQRLRGWNTYTNFDPLLSSATTENRTEMDFLTSRSKAEIVDMVRKQTYYHELELSRSSSTDSSNILSDRRINGRNLKARVQLFEKILTTSDVGKLNRLVIPKQQAERPRGCVRLNFLDVNDKVWRFTYSYWKSSRSYVLSRGWTWFVKDKNLKAGDVVNFERSSSGPDKQLYINFRSAGDVASSSNDINVRDMPLGTVLRLFGVDICRFPISGDAVEVW